MAQRLRNATKWFWVLLVCASPSWSPVDCVAVKTPPKQPSTIEAQAKFFQYRHLPTSEDYEQGHRLGSENHFTERHERSKPAEGLFSAKVRWGDKQGGYGEHYWDLNHAGHTSDHDGGYEGNSDDGSYREEYKNDAYEEPSDYTPSYDDGYDPEKAAKFDDTNRAKRHHPRTRNEKKGHKVYEEEDGSDKPALTTKPKARGEQGKANKPSDQNQYRKTVTAKQQNNYEKDDDEEDDSEEYEPESEEDDKERKQVVLVLNHKDKGDQEDTLQKSNQYIEKNPQQYASQKNQQPQQFQNFAPLDVPQDNQYAAPPYAPQATQQLAPQNVQSYAPQTPPSYVPYEGGAGVRHQQPEDSASAAVSRLFLEPSTGHIIDRATGRAYVLQPLAAANY